MHLPADPSVNVHLFYPALQETYHMKIVAALTDPSHAIRAQEQGADLVELRLDLMEGDPLALVQQCRSGCSLPVIATIRSAQEGGQFFGDAEDWIARMEAVIPLVDYVDIEPRFATFAPRVKAAGKMIISSHHNEGMLPLHELCVLERDLRNFGDIVKIIITPHNEEDILELIEFTHAIKKPLCTGVMGARFRYARVILPLFGSFLVYCSVGSPTAAGQYSVDEFIRIMDSLK
jgi:3-dehydroquinate dehydratase-1